ncbi:MAG: class I SAM-dependent methyltransferase [Chloroflexi bacterium]|nr:MAG: class I SAM-dependent methyltransferase [Chloroflexota bacterium]
MTTSNNSDAVRKQYENDELLRTRQEIHEQYTQPKIDFIQWALTCIPWQGSERVLDVGSGTGSYHKALQMRYPDIRYFGIDNSWGMLQKHPANGYRMVNGDAHKLPYADNSFDIVMANHMMYHLTDIDTAIREFKRVLKPEGLLMVATNSLHNMPEFQVLMRRAIVLLTRLSPSQIRPPAPASDLFALENGTRHLSRYFQGVVRYDLPTALVFDDVEPALRYLESTRSLREPQLPDDVMWDDMMLLMRQQITHLINHFGELAVQKLAGVLVATDSGGVFSEFFRIQHTVDSSQ